MAVGMYEPEVLRLKGNKQAPIIHEATCRWKRQLACGLTGSTASAGPLREIPESKGLERTEFSNSVGFRIFDKVSDCWLVYFGLMY